MHIERFMKYLLCFTLLIRNQWCLLTMIKIIWWLFRCFSGGFIRSFWYPPRHFSPWMRWCIFLPFLHIDWLCLQTIYLSLIWRGCIWCIREFLTLISSLVSLLVLKSLKTLGFEWEAASLTLKTIFPWRLPDVVCTNNRAGSYISIPTLFGKPSFNFPSNGT